ncbi:olfactory receptor 1002-like [Tachyglossus aculeatus]|uniref:olfactory receptor 1002-like n=1 Tax=Tachyglossus aculeatus TaxID=9261 RepID=UPI0018F2F07E|nr:olfactory receptor 1002-like [Tachyglossus aculeatus]
MKQDCSLIKVQPKSLQLKTVKARKGPFSFLPSKLVQQLQEFCYFPQNNLSGQSKEPSYSPNVINHYFCDIAPFLAVACADLHSSSCLLFILVGTVGVSSGLAILFSYVYILIAISRILPATRRQKAFSTCSSHLTTVTIL